MAIQSLRTNDCVEEVVGKYANMVFRLALAHVKTRHDADDIFQDVFLRYISKERTFESEEHRKAWLIRVTVNRCNSFWAALWSRITQPLDDTASYEQEEKTDLTKYIETLPHKYRTVIHLFYYEQLSVKQISEITKAKEATVKVRLNRARRMLKEDLKGEFGDEY